MGRSDVAAKVAEYARLLGAEGPDYQATALQFKQLQLEYLFNTVKYEAEKCLKAAQTANRSGDFDLALEELQRGRKLLDSEKNRELYLQLY